MDVRHFAGRLGAFVGAAMQDGDLVLVVDEPPHYRDAARPGTADHQDAHGWSLSPARETHGVSTGVMLDVRPLTPTMPTIGARVILRGERSTDVAVASP